MTEILDLQALSSRQAETVDVPVDGVGTFRLLALSALDKVELIELLAEMPKDDSGQLLRQRDHMLFGIELLARCCVDSERRQVFNSEPGRSAIGRLPMGCFQQLLDAAVALNGLGPGGEESELEAAKKN